MNEQEIRDKAKQLLLGWAGPVELIHVNWANDDSPSRHKGVRYANAFALARDGRCVVVRWCGQDRHVFDCSNGKCIESSNDTMYNWRIAPDEMCRYSMDVAIKVIHDDDALGGREAIVLGELPKPQKTSLVWGLVDGIVCESTEHATKGEHLTIKSLDETNTKLAQDVNDAFARMDKVAIETAQKLGDVIATVMINGKPITLGPKHNQNDANMNAMPKESVQCAVDAANTNKDKPKYEWPTAHKSTLETPRNKLACVIIDAPTHQTRHDQLVAEVMCDLAGVDRSTHEVAVKHVGSSLAGMLIDVVVARMHILMSISSAPWWNMDLLPRLRSDAKIVLLQRHNIDEVCDKRNAHTTK